MNLDRVSRPALPKFVVEDRRESGEWRTIAEFDDPIAAQRALAFVQAAGADVRVELIPAASIIP